MKVTDPARVRCWRSTGVSLPEVGMQRRNYEPCGRKS